MVNQPLFAQSGSVPFANASFFGENSNTHVLRDDFWPPGLYQETAIWLAQLDRWHMENRFTRWTHIFSV